MSLSSNLIVNLSTCFRKQSTTATISHFAELLVPYYLKKLKKSYCCTRLFSRFLKPLAEIEAKARVTREYHNHNNKFIKDYKLGIRDTKTFLKDLYDIFEPYIEKSNSDSHKEKVIRELQEKWNETIKWDDSSAEKFKALLETDEQIYFVSYTNPLHVDRMLELLKEHLPETEWLDADTSTKNSGQPIQIKKGMFLVLSYQYGKNKTGTSGLIEIITEKKNPELFMVVSQYKEDGEKAKELRIKSMPAKDFFESRAAKNLSSVSETSHQKNA